MDRKLGFNHLATFALRLTNAGAIGACLRNGWLSPQQLISSAFWSSLRPRKTVKPCPS